MDSNIETFKMKETYSSLSFSSTKKGQILHMDSTGLRLERMNRLVVAASPPTEDAVIAAEPLTKDDLVAYLASGCKPKEKWRCDTSKAAAGLVPWKMVSICGSCF